MRNLPALMVVAAGLLLAATWIGYPLWLRVRSGARGRRRPAGLRVRWPSVTMVVVVRNAEASLRGLLNHLLALAYPAELRRILVVSDASTDFTDAVAGLFAHRGVDLLRIPRPGLDPENLARPWIRSDLVVVVHPSARPHPGALAALVAPFADRGIGVTVGREVYPGARKASPFRRFEEWLRELESRAFGTVSARGTFYAVRGPIYRVPVPGRQSTDFAPLLTAREHGYRTAYVPDAECEVERRLATESDYARKMKAVARDVATLLRRPQFLDPRRYGAFAWELIGHKLGRWLTPWALLGGAAGLLLLAPFEAWARVMVACGAVIGLATGIACARRGRSALWRVASLPGRIAASAVAVAHGSLAGWLVLDASAPAIGSLALDRRSHAR